MKLKIISGSMRPLISAGDIVTIKPCDYSKIKLGDIVIFRIEKTLNIKFEGENKNINYVVHRVVGRKKTHEKKYLMQKGDIALLSGPKACETIFGKVTIIERKGYEIDLNKLRWKIINSILAIGSILEYRLGEIFKHVLRFVPKKNKSYIINNLLHYSFRFKMLIFRAYLFLSKPSALKKQR